MNKEAIVTHNFITTLSQLSQHNDIKGFNLLVDWFLRLMWLFFVL